MTTLILQPGAATGIDAALFEGAPDDNDGTGVSFPAGASAAGNKYRSLLQFDISALPASATISSATLTLYCQSEANATNRSVGMHRGLVLWYEGAENGADPGAADASTWNHRNANSGGPVAWTGGAGGVAATEWAAVATASTSITGTGVYFNWNVLADVQAWYGGANNYGWWMINASEGVAGSSKNFSSSDNATSAHRPKLTIVYTTTPDAAIEPKWRQPVHIVTPPKATGGHPVPVDLIYEADLGNDKVLGGAAIPVYIDSGNEAVGGKPMAVVVMTGRKRAGGSILKVRQTN